jgi:hypothetical protein
MQRVVRMLDFVGDTRSPSFPPHTGRRVVIGVAAAIALCISATSAILALTDLPEWWRGMIAASVATVVAAVLSLIPVLWGIRRGLNAAVAGYFIAMGVRPLASLGVASIAIYAGQYPKTSTLLLTASFYIAVLTVEAAVVAGAAWVVARQMEQNAAPRTTDAKLAAS